jgi:hypothetical protein
MKSITNWLLSPWQLSWPHDIGAIRQGTPPDEDAIEAEERAAEREALIIGNRIIRCSPAMPSVTWHRL